MKFPFFMGALLLMPALPAAELPETLARFGNIELKRERFQRFNIPAAPGQRRAALKKLVDTEIYLIIVRQLLQRSRIAPNAATAQKYIDMRKKQFPGKHTDPFFASLEKNVSNPEFQLKSALFFTFYAADPMTADPNAAEVRRHYELNRKKFQYPVKSNLAIMRAGANDDSGKEKAALILARLRQGEDFYTLAKQFDPAGRKPGTPPSPELRSYFKSVDSMAQGESRAIGTPRGIYVVKVLSRSSAQYRSFEEVKPYITEILSSARLKNSLEQYMREIIAKNPVQYFF